MAGTGGSNIRFAAVGTTDVGRIREHNEDNFLAVDLAAAKRGGSGDVLSGEVRGKGLSFVVADGMGGAAAGEVASQMAVDMLHEELKGADLGGTVKSEPAVINVLEAAIHKANESIFRKGQDSKDHQGMGTTLTAAVVVGDSLYLSQVGDSRGYVLRKGKLVQMTRDQSLIGQLIEEGTLTEEQAEKLGGKNIILQALGVEETLKIDSKRYDILAGDVLLLCSDGLSGMVPDSLMEEILNRETDLATAGKKLIQAANEGGGKDNITCVLARFEGEGLREPLSPLTEAEKAGGSFRAPEAPRSRAGRNAIVATAGVLAAVALFLFWPRGKTILLTVQPVPATVTVKGVGEAASKVDLPPQTSKPGEALRLDVPAGIQVELTAEAPGYQRGTRVVNTDVDHKEIPESMTLVRIPAKSLDFVPPEHRGKPLSRVRVQLEATEGQTAPGQDIVVQPEGDPELTAFPAGGWIALAKREGFRAKETRFQAESEKAEVVRLPEMEEVTGDLVVKDLPEGAQVTLLDGEEEILEKPAEVLSTRMTRPLKVRATSLVVRARKEGYEFLDHRVEVKEGAAPEVSFADAKGQVSFQNHTGSIALRGGKQPFLFVAGKTDRQYVDPGTYQLSYSPLEGDRVNLPEFKVEPGQIRLDIDATKLGK